MMPDQDKTLWQVNFQHGAFEQMIGFSTEKEAHDFLTLENPRIWVLRKINIIAQSDQ